MTLRSNVVQMKCLAIVMCWALVSSDCTLSNQINCRMLFCSWSYRPYTSNWRPPHNLIKPSPKINMNKRKRLNCLQVYLWSVNIFAVGVFFSKNCSNRKEFYAFFCHSPSFVRSFVLHVSNAFFGVHSNVYLYTDTEGSHAFISLILRFREKKKRIDLLR